VLRHRKEKHFELRNPQAGCGESPQGWRRSNQSPVAQKRLINDGERARRLAKDLAEALDNLLGHAGYVQHGYIAVARRRWPAAEWIIGDGHYASVARCGTVTVMLFATPAEAERAKALIDRTGCGHACRRDHEITYLDDAQPGPAGAVPNDSARLSARPRGCPVSPRTRPASPEEAKKIAAHAQQNLPCHDCGAAAGEPCTQPGRGRTVCKSRFVAAAIAFRRREKPHGAPPNRRQN
jgi:LRP1 type putative zinc finger protein